MGDNKIFNKQDNKTPSKEEVKKVKATKPTKKKDSDGNTVTDKWGNPTFF